MNAKAPPDAQDGSTSFPAPVVNLLSAPLTLPVRGDMAISHRFCVSPLATDVSPLAMEKITALSATDQHPGFGTYGTGVLDWPPVRTPARTSAS